MRLTQVLVRGGAVLALLAPLALVATPAAAGPTPTLLVSPAGPLTDFQRIELTGTGLEPGLFEWFQCRGGAVDESDCDGYNADFISVSDAGTVDEIIYVDARIYLPDGTEVDCRTDPAGCQIGVGFMVEAGQWPSVHLDFDPDAPLRPPVTAAVTPSDGLVDGQTVTVTGEHLSFREEAFAYLCAEGTGVVGSRCDMDRFARTVPDADGNATIDLTVRATFDPPLGDPVDCRAAGVSCYVSLGWSFDPPPDRRAQVPVSFAAEPTTTTTTTAPVEPPTPPPPATPVDGSANFTG